MKKSNLQLLDVRELNNIVGGEEKTCTCIAMPGAFNLNSVGLVKDPDSCRERCCERTKASGYIYQDDKKEAMGDCPGSLLSKIREALFTQLVGEFWIKNIAKKMSE